MENKNETVPKAQYDELLELYKIAQQLLLDALMEVSVPPPSPCKKECKCKS